MFHAEILLFWDECESVMRFRNAAMDALCLSVASWTAVVCLLETRNTDVESHLSARPLSGRAPALLKLDTVLSLSPPHNGHACKSGTPPAWPASTMRATGELWHQSGLSSDFWALELEMKSVAKSADLRHSSRLFIPGERGRAPSVQPHEWIWV